MDHRAPSSSCSGGVLFGRSVSGALLMRSEASELRVGRLAHVTLVRSLAGVKPHVVPERRRLTEAPVAETTHEWLVQRVDAHV